MISIRFCYFIPTFMFFLHSVQMINIWDTKKFNDLITTYDPWIGGILLGNNKSDESIFLYDESIFIFLD